MTATEQNELETDVQVGPDGFGRVVLRGRLDAQTAVVCWTILERNLRATKIKTLEVNAIGLRFCDGAGLALLRYLNMGKMTPEANISVVGLEAGTEKLFCGFTSDDYETFRPPARTTRYSLPEEVGKAVALAGADLREQVAFLGDIAALLGGGLVAFRRDTGAPVALLARRHGLEAVDPATGVHRPVDAALAASLRDEAVFLHRPLADARLTLRDLLLFGHWDSTRDLIEFLASVIVGGVPGLVAVSE